MKDVVARGRFAMGGLLSASIILILIALVEEVDLTERTAKIANLVVLLSRDIPSDGMKAFVEGYDQLPETGSVADLKVKLFKDLLVAPAPGKRTSSEDVVSEFHDALYLALCVDMDERDCWDRWGTTFRDTVRIHVSILSPLLRDVQSELSSFPDNQTIREAEEGSRPRVALPIVGTEVAARIGIPILLGSTIALLLYLASIGQAACAILPLSEATDGVDWIWFHPGSIGLVLAIAWVALPVPAAVFAAVRLYGTPVGIFLGLVVLGACMTALRILLDVRIRFQAKLLSDQASPQLQEN